MLIIQQHKLHKNNTNQSISIAIETEWTLLKEELKIELKTHINHNQLHIIVAFYKTRRLDRQTSPTRSSTQ